jgi:hypothetical protein
VGGRRQRRLRGCEEIDFRPDVATAMRIARRGEPRKAQEAVIGTPGGARGARGARGRIRADNRGILFNQCLMWLVRFRWAHLPRPRANWAPRQGCASGYGRGYGAAGHSGPWRDRAPAAGSDRNGANLRADFKESVTYGHPASRNREIAGRSGRGIGRERRQRRPAAQVSLPRKYLIGMDKRLKLAPFGSDRARVLGR